MNYVFRIIQFSFLLLLLLGIQAHGEVSKNENNNPLEKEPDSLLLLSKKYLITNPDSAILIAGKVLAYNKANTSLSAEATRLMADAYFYKDNFRKAIEYYQQSAAIEESIDGTTSVSYAERVNDIGYCYYMMGYNEMAIKKYQAALTIFRDAENDEETYTTINNIGTVYFKLSDYEKAISFYEQTLVFDKQQNNDANLSITYNNIGRVYHAWGKYSQAIKYYRLSMEHAKATGNQSLEAVKLSNIGISFYKMGEYDSAVSYVSRALEIDKQSGNKFKIAIRESEMAKIFAARGSLDIAIEYAKRALLFFNKANIRESKAIVLNDLGDFYYLQKSFVKSEQSYLNSLKIADEMGSPHLKMITQLGLSELYENWGKPVKALKYYKLYEKNNTEIFTAEKHRQLADFEAKYQAREKELENNMLKEENTIKQQRLVNLTIALTAMLLIIVLLLFGIRMKTKSIRQQKLLADMKLEAKEREKQHFEDKVFAEQQINRLQQEQYDASIKYKNQRLSSSMLNVIRKNELLIYLKEKIEENEERTEPKRKEIIRLINQNIDIDQDWKKFRYEFNQSYPGFFDKLKAKFPDLSETYLQLCAFLRIDLSSKEIAQIQNVSDSAVNKNRQRLRKKLNLEPEADLSVFLKKFA